MMQKCHIAANVPRGVRANGVSWPFVLRKDKGMIAPSFVNTMANAILKKVVVCVLKVSQGTHASSLALQFMWMKLNKRPVLQFTQTAIVLWNVSEWHCIPCHHNQTEKVVVWNMHSIVATYKFQTDWPTDSPNNWPTYRPTEHLTDWPAGSKGGMTKFS